MLSRRQFLGGMLGAALVLPNAQVGAPLTALRCPILMYHRVETPPADADNLRLSLTVLPSVFEGQLDWLAEQGYQTLTLAQMTRGLLGEAELPPKPVVLTFDDGYLDAYTEALPRLRARGMVGSFYVVPALMEQPGYLSWAQAGDMLSQGMEIGNHSLTHPDLSRLDRPRLEEEIGTAAQQIESALGQRPQTFCYPLGRYNNLVARVVQEQGHSAAITTRFGMQHSAAARFSLNRVRIPNTLSVEGFGWWISQ